MDDEIKYLIEELKILSSKYIFLRERIDGMVVFYLTGLAALVTAVIGLLSLQQITNELQPFGIGLAFLGIFVINAYVFVRILHFRYRCIETDIQMNSIRKMILNQGIKPAAYLGSDTPQNDIYIKYRSGIMIFGVGFISSIGLGLSVRSFVGKLLHIDWITVLVSIIISLAVFSIIQTRKARTADKLFQKYKTKRFAKKTKKSKQ